MTEPCTPCAEYRRGEREDIVAHGIQLHVCHRKAVGAWGFTDCPCGCKTKRFSSTATGATTTEGGADG
jgi:hypothetical protein